MTADRLELRQNDLVDPQNDGAALAVPTVNQRSQTHRSKFHVGSTLAATPEDAFRTAPHFPTGTSMQSRRPISTAPFTDTPVNPPNDPAAPGSPSSRSPHAGELAKTSMLVDVPKLVAAYFNETPDPTVPGHRVVFGTSGHRGSSFDHAFNEQHILAITQAICMYRSCHGIDGPLFLGADTHALCKPALASALEVLAANGADVMLSLDDEYTPTPAVSHAILAHNRGRESRLADGIVITPSHNPPRDGGFKYNPPHGGPAGSAVTD